MIASPWKGASKESKAPQASDQGEIEALNNHPQHLCCRAVPYTAAFHRRLFDPFISHQRFAEPSSIPPASNEHQSFTRTCRAPFLTAHACWLHSSTLRIYGIADIFPHHPHPIRHRPPRKIHRRSQSSRPPKTNGNRIQTGHSRNGRPDHEDQRVGRSE